MNWSLLSRSLISSIKTLCFYFIINLGVRSIILYIQKWKASLCILELDLNYYIPVAVGGIIGLTIGIYLNNGKNPFGVMMTEEEKRLYNPPLTPQEIKELDEIINKPYEE